MLKILYDDFDQKVKNIHYEMDLHHFLIKKAYKYWWYPSVFFFTLCLKILLRFIQRKMLMNKAISVPAYWDEEI